VIGIVACVGWNEANDQSANGGEGVSSESVLGRSGDVEDVGRMSDLHCPALFL